MLSANESGENKPHGPEPWRLENHRVLIMRLTNNAASNLFIGRLRQIGKPLNNDGSAEESESRLESARSAT
jgi:hypothetical protein